MGAAMTHKFAVGQLVYINEPSNLFHGYPRTVVSIEDWIYPYKLDDGFCYPEDKLSAESPTRTTPAQPASREWQTMDIDSGLGIGGIGNDQAAPLVPSVEAIERVRKLTDTDTICRKCGASQNFDGAMFTTISGGDICDDCV